MGKDWSPGCFPESQFVVHVKDLFGIHTHDESLRTTTERIAAQLRSFFDTQTSVSSSDSTYHHVIDTCCVCDDPPCVNGHVLFPADRLGRIVVTYIIRSRATLGFDRDLNWRCEAGCSRVVSDGEDWIDSSLHSISDTVHLAGDTVWSLVVETTE